MSRDYSKDLSELISSLSQTEKAYIKKSALRYSGDKNKEYLKLFDLIDRTNGNWQTIRKKPFKNLPSMKIYLQEAILKGLNQYHLRENDEMIVKEILQSVEVLSQKSLYS